MEESGERFSQQDGERVVARRCQQAATEWAGTERWPLAKRDGVHCQPRRQQNGPHSPVRQMWKQTAVKRPLTHCSDEQAPTCDVQCAQGHAEHSHEPSRASDARMQAERPGCFGSRRSLGRVGWFIRILGTWSIQNIQHPPALVARATNGYPQHQAQHFPRPHHVELPPRTDHLRLEHNKASDLLESLNERDVRPPIRRAIW